MISRTAALRELLKRKELLYLPAVYDALGARLVESVGFPATYVGGFVTGASLAITEPLLTMSEQVEVARAAARAVKIPVLADAGAGFGDPLHTMRTVEAFIEAGIAGIHIEDQLYPKRAHYHGYQVHAIARDEFVAKIKYACLQRDETDPDFLIIARSDTCREFGLDEAVGRINAAAEVGADMGLVFPRSREEAAAAPRLAKVPLIWVQSRGNRDGRPILPLGDLRAMGYRGCIDAQIMLAVAVHFMKGALAELVATGNYTALDDASFVTLRKEIEDLIGLDAYYRIEAATVEPDSKPG